MPLMSAARADAPSGARAVAFGSGTGRDGRATTTITTTTCRAPRTAPTPCAKRGGKPQCGTRRAVGASSSTTTATAAAAATAIVAKSRRAPRAAGQEEAAVPPAGVPSACRPTWRLPTAATDRQADAETVTLTETETEAEAETEVDSDSGDDTDADTGATAEEELEEEPRRKVQLLLFEIGVVPHGSEPDALVRTLQEEMEWVFRLVSACGAVWLLEAAEDPPTWKPEAGGRGLRIARHIRLEEADVASLVEEVKMLELKVVEPAEPRVVHPHVLRKDLDARMLCPPQHSWLEEDEEEEEEQQDEDEGEEEEEYECVPEQEETAPEQPERRRKRGRRGNRAKKAGKGGQRQDA